MVSMLATSAIDCGYELRSCRTKEYTFGICCFSAKNAALKGNFAIFYMLAKYVPGDMKEQRLVGSESEQCVRVERHIYPMTVVSSPCQRQGELLPSPGARCPSSFVRRLSSINYSHFNHLL